MSDSLINNACILIVEDDPKSIQVLIDLLEANHYQTRIAQTGKQALTIANKQPIDLILLDIILPGMDGYEICHQLKQNPLTKDIPVIFLTGLSQTNSVIEGFQAGSVDYISKPFVNEEILVRVKTHITLRKQQIELEQSKQYEESIIKNFLDIMLVIDTDGLIQTITHETCQFIGYDENEMIGHLIYDFLAEEKDLAKNVLEFYKIPNMLEKTQLRDIPLTFQTKDHRAIHMSLNLKLLNDHNGKIIGVVIGGKSLTLLKKSLKALNQSDNRFQTIFQMSPDMILICKKTDEIIEVNHCFCDRTGYCREYVLNKTIHQIGIFQDENIFHHIVNGLQLNEISNNREITFICKDSSIGTGLMSCAFIRIQDSDYIMTIIQDITKLKQNKIQGKHLEKQLIHNQKMETIASLANGVAHDLNNILQPIVGSLFVLFNRINATSIRFKFLQYIQDLIDRAIELIHQLNHLNQVDVNHPQKVGLQYLLKSDIVIFKKALPETVKIIESIDKNCCFIMADPVHIHQIFLNIWTNAVHAINTNGTIHIALERIPLNGMESQDLMNKSNYVRITVKDDGYGIKEELINKVFDPYFTTKPKNEGTGLGLSIVNNIVKTYGGYIDLMSKEGQGTTIQIYFPCAKERDENDNEDKHTPENQFKITKKSIRILAVDDEFEIIETFNTIFPMIGYQVTAISDPIDALHQFYKNPDMFSLVITDLTMPKLSGIELSKKILEIRPNLPIVLTTGYIELFEQEEILSYGIKKILKKAFTIKQLENTISEVLGTFEE